MASKYELITTLYERTRQRVSAPHEWQLFLTTACHNYRLSFDDQLLIFAQRPDATAVLGTILTWRIPIPAAFPVPFPSGRCIGNMNPRP